MRDGGSTLIRDCEVVVTVDVAGTEIPGGSILFSDGELTWIGLGPPPRPADTVIDGRGTVATPGLVNTHDHLFQSLTRVNAQQDDLMSWLYRMYPRWTRVDAAWQYTATSVGAAELALTGCTLTTDHHYLFPRGAEGLFEANIEGARRVGLRFHPCRGAMNLGKRDGGMPPDELVEDHDAVLAATEEAVARFHDPAPSAMVRVAVGPCYPLSVTEALMRDSAELARRHGLRLHTHIAEGRDEEALVVAMYGMRPVEYLEHLGYLAADVWLAHCVQLSDDDIDALARAATSVATCPSSNLRLGSGIARVRDLLDRGVQVGLGVDGAASSDASSMLLELRMLTLTQRAGGVQRGLSAREALRIATIGGARCLGRGDEVGSLEVGKRADIALHRCDGLETVGADSDPVAAIAFCAAPRVRDLFVEGEAIVRDGRLTQVDEDELSSEGHCAVREIMASVR